MTKQEVEITNEKELAKETRLRDIHVEIVTNPTAPNPNNRPTVVIGFTEARRLLIWCQCQLYPYKLLSLKGVAGITLRVVRS